MKRFHCLCKQGLWRKLSVFDSDLLPFGAFLILDIYISSIHEFTQNLHPKEKTTPIVLSLSLSLSLPTQMPSFHSSPLQILQSTNMGVDIPYYTLVYTPVDSIFHAVWLASQTQDSMCYSPPGIFLDLVHKFSLISQKKSGGGAGAGYPLVWCIPKQSFISVLVKSGFAARQISTTIHLHFFFLNLFIHLQHKVHTNTELQRITN